jgi:ABC-2 type transport system ATP-binding protein
MNDDPTSANSDDMIGGDIPTGDIPTGDVPAGDVDARPVALRLDGLTKQYGDTPALTPTTLTVHEGERIAIIGHNGSGKTTMMKMIVGLLEPSGGSAHIWDHAPGSITARRAVSWLGDTPIFYDDLSLREHLEYVAGMHGLTEWAERADTLIDRFGLTDRADRLPATFSRGLRQKAAVCIAAVRPFALLVVDEPFVGLDSPGKAALLAWFDEAAADGATLMIATHELSFVERVDRIIALRDGEVIYDGDAAHADVDLLVHR